MIFDQFDRIRIINLAHRDDRRREMTAELARVGVAIDGSRVAFFDAFAPSDTGDFYSRGAHGCYLSHLAILEEQGGSVLILEDDCDFTRVAREFEAGAFDIFYGGYDAKDPANLENSDIVGAHMMGYSAEGARRAAAYFRQLLDPAFRNHVKPPPTDGAIIWFRRAYPDIRTVFAVPPLAYQRPSRTDIAEQKLFDKLPVVGSAMTLARRIKRLFTRR